MPATVQAALNDLIAIDPAIREWLNRVELIGYTGPLHPFLEFEQLPDGAIRRLAESSLKSMPRGLPTICTSR